MRSSKRRSPESARAKEREEALREAIDLERAVEASANSLARLKAKIAANGGRWWRWLNELLGPMLSGALLTGLVVIGIISVLTLSFTSWPLGLAAIAFTVWVLTRSEVFR